ncbi:unnamed protein product [Moneuplotes crassus]|uniref:Uncharacterized protein n=1 Tax=Euplotes crassus TaxID=5936 RepID=A0AAD1URL3_EUPCR|nr:unnamed protein product [Moneuplotes crassus]
MESIPKATQEEITQLISLEKSILSKAKEQDFRRCQSILYQICPKDREIKPLNPNSEEAPKNSRLSMDFSDLSDIKLAQSFDHFRLFDINLVNFFYAESKNRHFEDFLEFSFPNKTNELGFISGGGADMNKLNYLNPLTRLSSKVIQRVLFQSFCIGYPQLKRLVAAYKHVRELGLCFCKLSIPSIPDFSKALKNCQIQKLNLIATGSYGCSDWENNLDEFKNLVQGLSSSPDLRLSLKKVNIDMCEIIYDEAEQIFEANQLGEVEIITFKRF